MVAVLLYSLLFIFGLVCTLISPTKKFLSLYFQPSHGPMRDLPKPASASATTHTPSGSSVDLRIVFATFDKNNDGYITKQELKESLKNMGISAGERDVEEMVEKVDSNGDGLIDFDEFCRLFDSISGREEEEDGGLKEAFDVFDGNKDGLITVEELGLVLSSLGFTEGNKTEDCTEMIKKVDMDGDGMVNFDEFKRMMRAGLMERIIPVS